MKQHNEVALISSGQLTVRANGLRLSIVTGIIQKHQLSGACEGNTGRWKGYLKRSSVLDQCCY